MMLHALSDEQMMALSEFSKKTSFGKVVALQVASQLSIREVPRINQIFAELDTSSQGWIGVEQTRLAFVRLGVPDELAERAARAMDLDGNNRVEYSELVSGLLSMWDDQMDRTLWQVKVIKIEIPAQQRYIQNFDQPKL
jgi:Ca2+-binding EF-hand superfamily protein